MPVILPRLMAAVTLLCAGAAWAQDAPVRGAPVPWQLNFQPAASPVMAMIESLHDLLLWIITAISVFVLGLLAYACLRFPEPQSGAVATLPQHACSRSPGPRSRC